MRHISSLAIAASIAGMALSSPASAALLAGSNSPTGILNSPGSVTTTFFGGAGAATVNFVIQAYLTLDGVNCCSDTFTFSVNNNALFQGAYNLGGGGTDSTTIPAPSGSTIAVLNGADGTITGSVPITLINGINSISFAYTGVSQGTGDEGWGVNSYAVNGNPFVASVPEPATWVTLICGFGMVGAGLRARRRSALRLARV